MARKVNLNSFEIYQKLGSPQSPPHLKQNHSPHIRNRSFSVESSPQHGSPDFSKQSPRKDLPQFAFQVHDQRFISFEAFPLISSKVPRVSAPDISRTTGRNFLSIYKRTEQVPDYNPDYSKVWKGAGKNILKFDMALPRKPLYKKSEATVNAKDINYSQIDHNICGYDIGKATSRPDSFGVPSHMVNIHYLDRTCGRTSVNFKGLEMNNYKNTDFLPMDSSFGTKSPKNGKSLQRKFRNASAG